MPLRVTFRLRYGLHAASTWSKKSAVYRPRQAFWLIMSSEVRKQGCGTFKLWRLASSFQSADVTKLRFSSSIVADRLPSAEKRLHSITKRTA
jgi:hypothetical protein